MRIWNVDRGVCVVILWGQEQVLSGVGGWGLGAGGWLGPEFGPCGQGGMIREIGRISKNQKNLEFGDGSWDSET